MKPELLDAALASVNTLVEDEIRSNTDGRYHRAQKLCQIAQRLAAMGVGDNRVADALAMEGQDYDDDLDAGLRGVIRPANLRRMGVNPGQMGMVDIFREALAAIQEQQRLQRVPRPERLLADLLDVRERMARSGDGCIPAALQERIDRLVAEVGNERDEQMPQLEEPPPVVEVDDNNAAAMQDLPPIEGADEGVIP